MEWRIIRDITEIWIIDKSGLCIFNYTAEEKMSASLFGGFITALNMFSNQISRENIQQMKIGKNLLVLKKFKNSDFLYIGRSEILSAKKLEKSLEKIYQLFVKKYNMTELKGFSGDISQFEDFSKDIEELFMDKTEKIQGMW